LDLSPLEHPLRAIFQTNLGYLLFNRFKISHSKDDLDGSIFLGEQSVASSATNRDNLSERLSNLGSWLISGYEITRSISYLDLSIAVKTQAAACTRSTDPVLSNILPDLGNALESRFEVNKMTKDIERAIIMHKQAVKTMPAEYPERARYSNNLALALQSHYNHTGDEEKPPVSHRNSATSKHADLKTPPGNVLVYIHPGQRFA